MALTGIAKRGRVQQRDLARRKPVGAPSFEGLKAASESSSIAKRANAHSNTRQEKILFRELRSLGLKFRKHDKSLPGSPDAVFREAQVVVFCDGDFWHGRRWNARQEKLRRGANAEYWLAKIQTNMNRDHRNNRLLAKMGWRVIRLWESDILGDPARAAKLVQKLVTQRVDPKRH